MSKAYNRVEWDFTAGYGSVRLFRSLGPTEAWVRRIKAYVTTVSFSFLTNGKVYGSVVPTRGLRQGNTLPPYLYLLVTEGLSSLIQKVVSRKVYKVAERGKWFRTFSSLTIACCFQSLVHVTVGLFGDFLRCTLERRDNKLTMINQPCALVKRLPKALIKEIHGLCCKFRWGSMEADQKIHWASWENLCKSKEESGMGFRDLNAFNQVLLAKQSWRLEKNPDSLAARRSLCWGCELFELGSRWQVGSGSSISIYDDRWVLWPHSFKVITTRRRVGLESVCQLKTESGGWNVPLLQEVFLDANVLAIMSIPVSDLCHNDSLCWHFTIDGECTVKSGYKVRMALSDKRPSSSGHQSVESWWNSVWRLSVPPKVKIILWSACKNWIPTRVNLAQRKIPVDDICPICNRCQETTMHALWSCPSLKEVRKSCGFMKGIRCDDSVDFKVFLAFCKHKLQGDELPLFLIILWLLWFIRNQKIHGTSEPPGSNVYVWCYDFLSRFRAANFVDNGSSFQEVIHDVKWQPPNDGFFKVNCDASIHVVL
ncbi:hypothetical protein Dsin_002728 [Dipteronia sinensis]|uniref:Reverse transcriptase zinc-binding domain-containing protein n=1 Tax=Dipteronia sinensis TaxID=43782 RepID=A0AAE0B7M8_9ROSI|nr:hypothetical protein Dsin_002728 [Dipteronia sinensis]